PRRLRHVVDIDGLSGHMLVRRVMGAAFPDAAPDLVCGNLRNRVPVHVHAPARLVLVVIMQLRNASPSGVSCPVSCAGGTAAAGSSRPASDIPPTRAYHLSV